MPIRQWDNYANLKPLSRIEIEGPFRPRQIKDLGDRVIVLDCICTTSYHGRKFGEYYQLLKCINNLCPIHGSTF